MRCFNLDHVEDELNLGDYVSILKRRWLWFLLPILAVPAAAYYLSVSQPDSFNASSQVLLSDSAAQDAIGSGSQSTSFRDRVLENEVSLALSDRAKAEMGRRFGLDPDDVPGFNITANNSADILLFSASATSPESAATIANVAAESYVFPKQEQASASITGAVTSLEETLLELQAERNEVRTELVRLEDELAPASDDDELSPRRSSTASPVAFRVRSR